MKTVVYGHFLVAIFRLLIMQELDETVGDRKGEFARVSWENLHRSGWILPVARGAVARKRLICINIYRRLIGTSIEPMAKNFNYGTSDTRGAAMVWPLSPLL